MRIAVPAIEPMLTDQPMRSSLSGDPDRHESRQPEPRLPEWCGRMAFSSGRGCGGRLRAPLRSPIFQASSRAEDSMSIEAEISWDVATLAREQAYVRRS